MSLAFSFQLTPRQTEMLLVCAYGHYKAMDSNCIGQPPQHVLPDFDCPCFVTVGKKLIEKGLLTHSNDRIPTWQSTDIGKQMAAMIVGDARKIVAYADTAKPLPKTTARKAVK